MTATNKQILDRAVAENCFKLFADYELKIRAREPGDALNVERFLMCGIIGFTSKKMRGVLALATTKEPLELTNHTTTTHRDWICELANQLLGRVKNQMLLRGVEIVPSTPIALRGDHLSPVTQQGLVSELFTAERGLVCVWMDCEFDDDFVLPEAGECATPPVPEGDLLLF
jgi:hypothetical protein